VHVFFVIEVGGRHVHVLGATSSPDGARTVRAARILLTDRGEHVARFPVPPPRPRRRFTAMFDAVLAAAGIDVITPRRAALAPTRTPSGGSGRCAARWPTGCSSSANATCAASWPNTSGTTTSPGRTGP
jgi:hypothetical protein